MAKGFKVKAGRKKKSEALEFVKVFSVSIAVALAVSTFVRPTLAKGQSMEPTIRNNDYLIVSSASMMGKPPQFGDLIVFDSPVASKEGYRRLLKRVIGVPGDVIEIRDGVVYRNHEALQEEYIKDGTTLGELEEFVVEKNTVFVLGDNRANSLDSRNESLRTIRYEDIVGKVSLRLFPFNRLGAVK